MDISIFGFNLLPGSAGVTLNDVLERIARHPLETKDNRIVAVTREGQNWKGVILSIRDVKHFTKIRQEQGRFTITAEQMEDGARPVDFNFFVINSRTNRGLYQHYHQSSSLNHFCWLLKGQYDDLRKERRNAALVALGEEATGRQKQAAHAPFKGSLRYQMLLRPGSFEECVEALAKIKIFEFQFAEFRPVQRAFRALEGVARRVTHRVAFQPHAAPADQRNSIITFLRNSTLFKAKVVGMDPHGIEQTFHLQNDLATFGTFDYDQLVNGMMIDSVNLQQTINQCAISGHLLNLMNTRQTRALFDAVVSGEGEEMEEDGIV